MSTVTLTHAGNNRCADLARRLSLGDSIAIVVGSTIGGGIFFVPNLVPRSLHSLPIIIRVWVFAGVVSLFGALACAELGAMFPATGGQYVFLREAYGPATGFLCGWSLFTVGRSAQAAWLAVVFSQYVGYFVPLGRLASTVLSLTVLAFFTWVNYRGVKLGALVQNSFTGAKVTGLLVIVGAAFLLTGHRAAGFSAQRGTVTLGSFGVA